MDVKVTRGDLMDVETPALIVNLFEGVKAPGGATGAVDKALDGIITNLIEDGEIKGTRGENTLIHTMGKILPARILVAGLGKQENFDADNVRRVVGGSSRYLRRLGISKACTIAHGCGVGGMDAIVAGQAIAEGAILGLYRFNDYFSTGVDGDNEDLGELTILEMAFDKIDGLKEGVRRGKMMADAAITARNMVNEPSNILTPTRMADISKEIADKYDLELTVLDRAEMETKHMGAMLAVAKGSHQPPKFIVLKYSGDPGKPENTIGFIGKGITFDSGGISIKPSNGMEDMKGDMAGGASVIAAMKVIGQLKPKINVTAVVAATENMPGGAAQRPGDVIRSMSGKTVEVINTDAEGRLVLADALHYAKEQGITRLVDVATLTGAMVVALGTGCSGVMGNDQELVDCVIRAGASAGERIWQLPLYDDYREQIKSNVADIKNTGGGRGAGSITAGLFLAEFTSGTQWVHLDIAGTYMANKDDGYLIKGGTGVPTRTLINLAIELAREAN